MYVLLQLTILSQRRVSNLLGVIICHSTLSQPPMVPMLSECVPTTDPAVFTFYSLSWCMLVTLCVSLRQVFKEAIKAALAYRESSTDFIDQVMRELEVRYGTLLEDVLHV